MKLLNILFAFSLVLAITTQVFCSNVISQNQVKDRKSLISNSDLKEGEFEWRGQSPFCAGECYENEKQICQAADDEQAEYCCKNLNANCPDFEKPCLTGYKVLCKRENQVDDSQVKQEAASSQLKQERESKSQISKSDKKEKKLTSAFLWRGTSPFCAGECYSGEVETCRGVDSEQGEYCCKALDVSCSDFGKTCLTGYKVLCKSG